jgi:hypothetical protein
LIYQFDSTDCYNYNSLTFTDIGNSQLQIAAVITSTYSFSSNGDTMSIAITGLGDLQMVRDSFNVSSWIECTYNWKCNSTDVLDVLEGGKVNFELSDKNAKPCKLYLVEKDNLEVSFELCEDKVKLKNFSFGQDTCSCN